MAEARQNKNVWDPDVEVSEGLAARLIARRFTELAGEPVEPFGAGWDNAAFLVGGRLVFRFPQRAVAVPLLVTEARVLPLLAPHLPLPVPAPSFVAAAGDGEAEGYPYPFAGYPRIPGATADRARWASEGERAACAEPLARFLAALHKVPVSDETRAWAPPDVLGRADLPKRARMAGEKLANVPDAHLLAAGIDRGAVLAGLERLSATPAYPGPTCWVHGDLYPRHVLVDEVTRLPCGVIDWGDVHLGDPALDLSVAFTLLPPFARGAFRDAYGSLPDPAAWDRARFRALFYGAALTEYGLAVGDAFIRESGERALRSALTE